MDRNLRAIDFAPLCLWYRGCARALPWRADTEPYHVWVSEVMLQQTRIETVIPYYARFLEALPTIESLAACPEDRLLKLWEGLGYYSRARNLRRAAQQIVAEYGGVFPHEPLQIRALPGIGEYTAGAVASICFGLPEPAVDGNVLRIAARLLELREPVTESGTKRKVTKMLRTVYMGCDAEAGAWVAPKPLCRDMPGKTGDNAKKLRLRVVRFMIKHHNTAKCRKSWHGKAVLYKRATLNRKKIAKTSYLPGVLTQALMELGETVCLPGAQPRCDLCPLHAECLAFANGTAGELPLRAPQRKKREAEITVLLLIARAAGAEKEDAAVNSAKTQGAERIAIRKRPNTGLLAGLWEFPNTEGALTQKQASAFAKSLGVRPVSVRKGSSHIHTFTHIKWKMRSYEIECEAPIENELPIDREAPECDRDETTESTTLLWVEPEALRRDHALPTAFRKLL